MRTSDPLDPINALYEEHDAALAHLEILGRTADEMAEGGPDPDTLGRFDAALAFLEGKVREHNQWEENFLFPLLELRMGPGGPSGVMRAEHSMLWRAYSRLEPLHRAVKEGTADATTLRQISEVAHEIVQLLSDHIAKENEILFPMARRMLSPKDLESLREARPRA